MSRYRAVVRVVFAVAFLGGALVHLYFGLFSPHSYAPFADTVLWLWLAELWRGFVMANIGWLSLLNATLPPIGAVLGYSWPADGWWEDFVKNRAGTLVMAAALVPLLHVPERSPRT